MDKANCYCLNMLARYCSRNAESHSKVNKIILSY
uniref:Uncharacterized protein n=1 Tax=Arundo donax TaxID=35708 RepID=A0A0A9AEK3_ARUDO